MKTLAMACIGALVVCGPFTAWAQDETEAGTQKLRPKPCTGEPYRDFDFWLGDWDVSGPDGQVAGQNSVTSEQSGCLIVEHWTGAQGGTGQSFNFYDPGLDQWRQVWVSPGATIDYAGELNGAGEMVLKGEISYRNKTSFPFRGTWTPNGDGSVTQAFEQYDPDANSWNDWFTGTYRKSEAPSEETSTE